MERSHEAEMRPTPSLDVASDLVHSPRTKSVCLQNVDTRTCVTIVVEAC
jgi:hypothetical protein